jgi:hypothetical protein
LGRPSESKKPLDLAIKRLFLDVTVLTSKFSGYAKRKSSIFFDVRVKHARAVGDPFS